MSLIADSSETIELEDLDRELKDQYQILLPDYLKTKNEKLIYKFNHTLRYLSDELMTAEQYRNELSNEMKEFLIEPINVENSYIQQIRFLQHQIQMNRKEKLLKSIEKMKVLINKLETMNEQNLQYHFLLSKLDRLYEVFHRDYQIELPDKTDVDSIRTTMNKIRKKTTKELEDLDKIQNELVRKLDVLNKKEELKQRTKITSITEVKDVFQLYLSFCYLGIAIQFIKCLYPAIKN